MRQTDDEGKKGGKHANQQRGKKGAGKEMRETAHPQLGEQLQDSGAPVGNLLQALEQRMHLPQLDIAELRVGMDVCVGDAQQLLWCTRTLRVGQHLQHSDQCNIVLRTHARTQGGAGGVKRQGAGIGGLRRAHCLVKTARALEWLVRGNVMKPVIDERLGSVA